jgi:membrane protein required for colicin V production
MNALDWALVVLFVAGFVVGLARGFTRILIGILSLLVAFFLANRWQEPLAQTLVSRHVGEGPARIAAYVLIFVGTMIAGGLVAWVVGKMLKVAMLSWADRMAGGALGLLAAVLAAAFIVHPIVVSTKGGSQMLATSELAPYVAVVADLGNAVAPEAVAQKYEAGMETLRKVWRGEAAPELEAVKKKITKAVDVGAQATKSAAEKTEKAVSGSTKKP